MENEPSKAPLLLLILQFLIHSILDAMQAKGNNQLESIFQPLDHCHQINNGGTK